MRSVSQERKTDPRVHFLLGELFTFPQKAKVILERKQITKKKEKKKKEGGEDEKKKTIIFVQPSNTREPEKKKVHTSPISPQVPIVPCTSKNEREDDSNSSLSSCPSWLQHVS